MPPRIPLDKEAIQQFCERWGVTELSLFGSVLRDDFTHNSDVDVMVSFKPGERRTLLDMAAMRDELASLVGREVDLVTRRAIASSPNHLRRRAILEGSEVVHGP